MMKTELTLQDMTKAELIALIQRCYPRLEARELRNVRRLTLSQRAHVITAQAQAEMDANRGTDQESLRNFIAASKKFDRGMKLYDQSSALFNVDYKPTEETKNGADTHGNY